MLTRAGALLTSAGIASAVIGAASGRVYLLFFGLTLTLYMVVTALLTSLAGKAFQSQACEAARVLAGTDEGANILLGRELAVTVELENRTPLGWARLWFTDITPRSFSGAASATCAAQGLPFSRIATVYKTRAEVVGPATFGGIHAWISDLFDLYRQERFFPVLSQTNILALPREQGGTAFRGAGTRRPGEHRYTQKGMGSDLREIRSYLPGDALRKIAWKNVARTGRLLARETEAELNVICHLFIDTSPSMRAGRYGRTSLDSVIRAAAVVAAEATRAGDPFGLGLFSDLGTTLIRPAMGKRHLIRVLRNLAAAKERPPEEQLPLAALGLHVQGYIHGLDPSTVASPLDGWKPGTVYAWITREYFLGPELAQEMTVDERTGRKWLLLFCQDRGIIIPPPPGAQVKPSGAGRDRMLLALVKQALVQARERELFVVFSDFEGVEASPVLLQAFRLVRARHHAVLLVSPFTPWFETEQRQATGPRYCTAAEVAEEMYTLGFSRERTALREAVRRLGIPVRDVAPDRMAATVLEEVARLKRDRAAVQ